MERDYDLLDTDTLNQFENALRHVYSELNLARIYDKEVNCDDFFNEICVLFKSVSDYRVIQYKELSSKLEKKCLLEVEEKH